MPSEDYTPVTSGALKLKGVNPSARVGKHKKKRPKDTKTDQTKATADSTATNPEADGETAERGASTNDKHVTKEEHSSGQISQEHLPTNSGKTDAELRHEERRRKRLDERLKREGTKTHKERVEELNRYLSNLSEHHDM